MVILSRLLGCLRQLPLHTWDRMWAVGKPGNITICALSIRYLLTFWFWLHTRLVISLRDTISTWVWAVAALQWRYISFLLVSEYSSLRVLFSYTSSEIQLLVPLWAFFHFDKDSRKEAKCHGNRELSSRFFYTNLNVLLNKIVFSEWMIKITLQWVN